MEYAQLVQEIWAKLVRGAADRKHEYHFPALATAQTERGCSVRTVVLRKVVPTERQLICYTDYRSAKVQDLQANDRVEWLFYHHGHQEQIRLSGRIRAHRKDMLSASYWQRVPDEGKKDYVSPLAPGASLQAGDLSTFSDPLENFTVLVCTVDRIDWLQLGRQSHQRAVFDWDGRQWNGGAVVP